MQTKSKTIPRSSVFERPRKEKEKEVYIFFPQWYEIKNFNPIKYCEQQSENRESHTERSAEVQQVQAYIQIIELQCKRYRLKIRRNSVGVLWSKTQDALAPRCLSSGQDQDKPNNTKCQCWYGQNCRGHWKNNQIIGNLEFHLKLATNTNFFKERRGCLSCLEQYCFVRQPMGP